MILPFTNLIRTWRILLPEQRRRAGGVILVKLGMPVLELFGIGAILIFFRAVTQPSMLHGDRAEYIFDWLGISNDRDRLIAVGSVLIMLFVLRNIGMVVATAITVRYQASLTVSFQNAMLRKYFERGFEFFLRSHSQVLQKNVLTDCPAFTTGVVAGYLTITGNILMLLVISCFLLVYDWQSTLIIIFFVSCIYVFLYFSIRPIITSAGDGRHRAVEAFYRAVNNPLVGSLPIIVANRLQYFLSFCDKASHTVSFALAKLTVVSMMPRYIVESVAFTLLVIIVLAKVMTAGNAVVLAEQILVYAVATYRLLPQLDEMLRSASGIRRNRRSIGVLEQYLDSESTKPRHTNVSLNFSGSLKFDNVSFHYFGTKPNVLKNITLQLPQHGSVALVGPSGAGKTTLVYLMLGLLEPTSGRILIGKHPLTKECLDAWRARIGYVPQDLFLLDDTVSANIAFGENSDNTDEMRVKQAAEKAQIADYVETLPDKYATIIGERGLTLSGGQRQRIGIARALYMEPQLLVLDEATSAVDGITEQALVNAIERLSVDRSLVVVAHRLSTVRRCKIIVVVDSGCIIDIGEFDELNDRCPLFQEMVARQSGPTTNTVN